MSAELLGRISVRGVAFGVRARPGATRVVVSRESGGDGLAEIDGAGLRSTPSLEALALAARVHVDELLEAAARVVARRDGAW